MGAVLATTTVDGDQAAARPLDDAECRALLGAAAVGRVGLSIDALPVVLPVAHVLDGDRIVFRTGSGAKLQQALEGAVVCFQADEIDERRHAGWSVLATGHAREITDAAELRGVRTLPLRPWTGVDGEHYVEIRIELLSGRRFGPAD
ncbi:MAG TPA: pyridoxamine 5'-phosphate oxidase family protein [Acidimicrobiales bacterium]|nr:pyridoxamine 5'-phosphate oxidase family protein [Acidimicrobiales bacterium]